MLLRNVKTKIDQDINELKVKLAEFETEKAGSLQGVQTAYERYAFFLVETLSFREALNLIIRKFTLHAPSGMEATTSLQFSCSVFFTLASFPTSTAAQPL